MRIFYYLDVRPVWKRLRSTKKLPNKTVRGEGCFEGFTAGSSGRIYIGLRDIHEFIGWFGPGSFRGFINELIETIDHELSHAIDVDGRGKTAERVACAFEIAGRWTRQ